MFTFLIIVQSHQHIPFIHITYFCVPHYCPFILINISLLFPSHSFHFLIIVQVPFSFFHSHLPVPHHTETFPLLSFTLILSTYSHFPFIFFPIPHYCSCSIHFLSLIFPFLFILKHPLYLPSFSSYQHFPLHYFIFPSFPSQSFPFLTIVHLLHFLSLSSSRSFILKHPLYFPSLSSTFSPLRFHFP